MSSPCASTFCDKATQNTEGPKSHCSVRESWYVQSLFDTITWTMNHSFFVPTWWASRLLWALHVLLQRFIMYRSSESGNWFSSNVFSKQGNGKAQLLRLTTALTVSYTDNFKILNTLLKYQRKKIPALLLLFKFRYVLFCVSISECPDFLWSSNSYSLPSPFAKRIVWNLSQLWCWTPLICPNSVKGKKIRDVQ